MDGKLARTNYILIDYENVQPSSLELLNGATFKVLVFVGANQAKIPLEFARSLQALGQAADYVQISGNGSNALDFHIAFTVGELSVQDPTGYFHIVSKDTGFDPLIQYLRAKKIHAHRSKDIAEIPFVRVANAATLPEKLDAIVRNLTSRGSGRPRKTKTLKNTINSLFQRALEDSELDDLVRELVNKRHIAIESDNVTYHLASPP